MKHQREQNGVVILLVSVFLFSSCFGQSTKEKISQKEGSVGTEKLVKTLGSNEYANVHCGLRDKSGVLWFGTTGEGVYRYDGKLFTQYTMKDGLSSNTIWSVLEDKEGAIWFGTADGATKFDGKSFSTVPIVIRDSKNYFPNSSPNNSSAEKNSAWTMMQDKSGRIWFGTTNGVFIKGENDKFSRLLDNDSIINKNNLHLKTIEGIVEDKKGKVWLGSSGGEGLICLEDNVLRTILPLNFGRVMSIIETRDRSIWLGTANQGAVRSVDDVFISVTKKAGIETWVYDVFEDSKGNIWSTTEEGSGQIGEDGGIYRYDGKSFVHFSTKDGLPHNGVFCVLEDKDGNLWFGTRNTGLCKYDGKTFTIMSE